MKIEHVTNNVTDTDILADVPAALLEAAETFRKECFKYKRQFFLTLNETDDPNGESICFWNYLSEHMTETNSDVAPRELGQKEGFAFYSMIGKSISKLSGGNFALARILPPEIEETK